MSGILDKKSRIIDFTITENGRSQIESGDIRYKFASLSDSSIIYTKDQLSKSKNFYSFYPFIMQNHEAVDIDTETDWQDALKLYNYRKFNKL